MQIQPYLFFDGHCDEAIKFYTSTLGAEVTMLTRFKDNPEAKVSPMCAPGNEDKVMHASVRIGDSTILMSDGEVKDESVFKGFSLSMTVANDAEAQRLFAALAQGGKVKLPLAKTFFASSFGMLSDRFGVAWMVYVVA